jgi:hypothetical protein
MSRRILLVLCVVAAAWVVAGCGVDDKLSPKDEAQAASRSGTVCYVVDPTYSARLNSQQYLARLQQEANKAIEDDGPRRICVVMVTGSPSVSSSVMVRDLSSTADAANDRSAEIRAKATEVFTRAAAPFAGEPLPCPQRGDGRAAKLAGAGSASSVVETLLVLGRRHVLDRGDRVVMLSDGLERHVDDMLDMTSTPLLALGRAQPDGENRFLDILERRSGKVEPLVLDGVNVEFPVPAGQTCPPPYSEKRGNAIVDFWTNVFANRTGAEVTYGEES